jgi:hypothetical protein
MTDHTIMDAAISNVKSILNIDIQWVEKERKYGGLMYDGTIKLEIDNTKMECLIEVKRELRTHQLDHIEKLRNNVNTTFILVAYRLTSEMKMELRRRNIAYIEANGNLYIKKGKIFMFVDGQTPIKAVSENTNRAFTKTGLKVIFHLLIMEDLINKPYREIAVTTDVALGNINYVFTGLKDMGYILKLTKDKYKLINKDELLERWLTGYAEKLKPALFKGTFAFTTELATKNWKEIEFKEDKTFWAGEPGGDLMTNHLRPELFTIFTVEKPHELMINYKLAPNENGKIKVYQKFWNLSDLSGNTAPPLLIYADLITTTDKRCQETAKIIYDKYIQPNL